MSRRPAPDRPLDGERTIDALEAAHNRAEQIEALASTVAGMMQDVAFPRDAAARRFTRLVGLLADECENARASISEAIERLTARK